MSRGIYRFSVDYGRNGDLSGLFVVTQQEELVLRKLILDRTPIYLGEVLGKHSEIILTLQEKHLQKVEATEEEIQTITRILKCSRTLTGFNPLDYLEEEEG